MPKYGETKCQASYKTGLGCKNGAYYEQDGKFLCGVHSQKTQRRALQKFNKEEKKDRYDIRVNDMFKSAEENRGKKGELLLCLFRNPLSKPRAIPGFIDVYPNFKPAWQGVGVVVPGLSPMSLGPVNHGQEGLPECLILENFHQGSKRFRQETITQFEENRIKYFKDTEPHRHKFKGDEKNPNIPLYFSWKDQRLGYVESRQFYCNFYERLVKDRSEYKILRDSYTQGYKLRICGPDAYPLIPEDIEKEYLNPDYPFGHERVLYTMILLHDTPEQYPWRKHKTMEF
jgi:hypothetical protein